MEADCPLLTKLRKLRQRHMLNENQELDFNVYLLIDYLLQLNNYGGFVAIARCPSWWLRKLVLDRDGIFHPIHYCSVIKISALWLKYNLALWILRSDPTQ